MGRKKTSLCITTDQILQGYSLSRISDKQAIKSKEHVYLRGKKLTTGNISLFLDVCRNGTRIKQYLGLYLNLETSASIKIQNEETFRIAKTIAAEKNAELQRNENGFSISKKMKTSFISYALLQADVLLKKSGNPNSYYYVLHSLAKHIELYSGKSTTFQQIDKSYVLGFISYLKTAKSFQCRKLNAEQSEDTGISPNTQHNLFAKFSYIMDSAIKDDIISVNPIYKVGNESKPKLEDGKREFLTIEEIKKLIATPCKNDVLKRSFLFCCLTGLRYSDISTLTWEELTKDSNGFDILRFKMQKVKRSETAYISSEALKWLPERSNVSDNDRIYPLSKNDCINKQLARWVKAAGITKRITFHCSRHTAATLNLSLGTPIETVSKMLGHKNITTTQIYAKIIDEKRKEAVNRQNGIFD